MRSLVTGAAGFVGSNLTLELERQGHEVTALDDFTASNFENLQGFRGDFIAADLADTNSWSDRLGPVDVVFHEAAITDTTVMDQKLMMRANVEAFRMLLRWAAGHGVRTVIYASSAGIYGDGAVPMREEAAAKPLNIYAFSKRVMEKVAKDFCKEHPKLRVVGLRYFNVYGSREQHKGRMASVAYHFFNQYRETGRVKLFEGCDGYANGGQLRDFVSIEDVVNVNMFFLDHPDKSGIFNLGTGQAQSFNDVAATTINTLRAAEGKPVLSLAEMQQQELISYIPFPDALRGKYQSYTQADIGALRSIGYTEPFFTVEQGVKRYVEELLRAAG